MTKRTARVRPADVLFPLGLGTALSLMGDATLYTVLPTHTADAGITLGGVGILLGVNRAVRLFLNGPAGLAYDRWSRRWLFVPSLFVGALSTAIYAATRGFWPLFAGRLLWGLAWSGIWVGGATMILDVATVQERGRWTGLYQIWYFVGGAVGALGGGVLTDWLGYAVAMWIGAALTAAGGLAALALLPETRGVVDGRGHHGWGNRRWGGRGSQREGAMHSRQVHRTNGGQAAGPVGGKGRSGSQSNKLVDDGHNRDCRDPSRAARGGGRLRDNRQLWLAVSLQGVNRFAISGVMSATLGLLVRDRLPSAPVALGVATLTGILMAGRTLLSMAAAPLAGTLSDRMGSRWRVASWGLIAGMIGMFLLAWGVPLGILAGVSVMAISRGSVQSLATALTGDLVDQAQRGRAIGLLHTVGDFGSAVGPSIAYALLPWIGLHGVYMLCAVLYLVSFALVLRFSRPGRR